MKINLVYVKMYLVPHLQLIVQEKLLNLLGVFFNKKKEWNAQDRKDTMQLSLYNFFEGMLLLMRETKGPWLTGGSCWTWCAKTGTYKLFPYLCGLKSQKTDTSNQL